MSMVLATVLTVLLALLVASTEGFFAVAPSARSSMPRFSSLHSGESWAIDDSTTIMDGSLDETTGLAGRMMDETNLVQDGLSVKPRSPVVAVNRDEDVNTFRKTKISASAKETGYESINNYMVSAL